MFISRHGVGGFFFSSRRRHTRYWRDWSSDVCSSDLDDLHHPQSRIRDLRQISRGKFDRLPCIAAESTFCAFDGNGLRETGPARPTLTPSIRFLSIGSHVCSTLPSDPASRRRPCASLSLHLHQVVKGTSTPKLSIMLGTPGWRRASPALRLT